MKSINIAKINQLSDKKIWFLFFSYILIVTLLIQLIILPYLLPQWHAGNGLIVGGDFVRFHRFAEEQAANVKDFGWEAFTLYPHRQFVSGVASILYILFFPLPVVVLPLNAILHATAGLILFKILSLITQNRAISLVGAALFVVFPSSLRWVSQMHNDSYAILGAFLFLYGWVQLDAFLNEMKTRTILIAVLSVLFGILITALVRAYLIEVYLLASLVLGLYLILRVFIQLPLKTAWLGSSVVVLLILTQASLGELVIQPQVRLSRQGNPLFSSLEFEEVTKAKKKKVPKRFTWEESTFLPSMLDDRVSDLILKRYRVIRNWSEGSSGIDSEVDLTSSMKTLLYLPRALQIALFAPFPTDWFDEGTKAPSNFMKRVAALETSFVYLLFPFLLIGAYKWRSNSAMHLMLLFSLYFLTVYAIATPNVGNLYRFRYPYFFVLVSLGAASLTHLVINLKK